MKNGVIECSVCHSKIMSPTSKTVSRAYDRHRSKVSSKQRVLNVLLVVGDCFLVGLQPVLVYMSKVDGKFNFSPVSVNFLTEVMKVIFAMVMLLIQARNQKVGEKPLLSVSTFVQAARNNVLLAVPALLYAVNNYLKFIMQVLVIAVLLRMVMRRISVNQMRSGPSGPEDSALGLPVATGAYIYTLIFVTVPSLASVFNEYALKSQYETSIYLQNLFLYGYGAIFNLLAIVGIALVKDTILKKYSSTVATIFTGFASAALFGHRLTINFMLGISIVFISMHQFFSPLSKVKDEQENNVELVDVQNNIRSKDPFIDMAAGANEEVNHEPMGLSDDLEACNNTFDPPLNQGLIDASKDPVIIGVVAGMAIGEYGLSSTAPSSAKTPTFDVKNTISKIDKYAVRLMVEEIKGKLLATPLMSYVEIALQLHAQRENCEGKAPLGDLEKQLSTMESHLRDATVLQNENEKKVKTRRL
uniref:Uncharacterized protein n=1 Tax=Chenopodium quinoa TaxID=63459 RepID=A0A803KU96_CHEQI